jgi:hypothetical protein
MRAPLLPFSPLIGVTSLLAREVERLLNLKPGCTLIPHMSDALVLGRVPPCGWLLAGIIFSHVISHAATHPVPFSYTVFRSHVPVPVLRDQRRAVYSEGHPV